MLVAAWGLLTQRYWAVLGFQALLAITIVVAALSLLVASNIAAVVLCLVDRGRRRVALLEARARPRPDEGPPARGLTFHRLARMASATYDVIVIGSGPGGYVAAIRAAQLGMTTAVVEKDRIGGRCLNYACIPAKAVLRSADVVQEVREAGDFGITVGEPTVDFGKVMERRDEVVGTLTGGVGMLLKKHKVDVHEGVAALTAAGTVQVGDQELEATKAIVLATGSVKRPIPGTTFEGRVIGTEEAWALKELPANLAVVGAGASGTEIASAYVRLGSKVQLFEGLDRVLPVEDADVSKAAARGFKKQGIEVHTKTFVTDVVSGESSVTFTYGEEQGEADWLVIAAGRGPDVEALGLDAAGIKLDEHGLIAVDGQMRTERPEDLRHRRHRPRAGARPQVHGGGRDRRRARRRPGSAPARLRGHPGRDVLHAERRELRADRAAGQGRRP